MERIKYFEEFIGESFNSDKLRVIINQNGQPKGRTDRQTLQLITDDDIIEVMDSKEECEKKYDRIGTSYWCNDSDKLYITLGNNKVLVLKNSDGQNKETLFDRIEKVKNSSDARRNLRRGDKLSDREPNNIIDEQKRRKFLNDFLENPKNVDELTDKIDSYMEKEMTEDGIEEIPNIVVDGKNITVFLDMSTEQNGTTLEVSIETITIHFEEEDYDFDGIDDELYNGDMEFEIEDFYEYDEY